MFRIINSSFNIVAVSTVVTSVLVLVISVLISSSVVYLVMKRKYTSNYGRDYQKNEESNNKATVIYDLPNVAVDDKTIQPNAAYGVI